MKPVQRPARKKDAPRHICIACGKPSEDIICDECSERIRMEALSRKKREERGNSWSPWE